MVVKLTEDTFTKFIDQSGFVVVKATMPDCVFCEQYAPVFEALVSAFPAIGFAEIEVLPRSAFKREYMKASIGEKLGAPGTFLFQDGKLVNRRFGLMSIEKATDWITRNMATAPEPATEPVPEKTTKKISELTIQELKAIGYDAIVAIEKARITINEIQTELAKR